MPDYTRWYRVGTVALTKNSKIVTGTGTFWLAAGLNPGDLFTVDASQFYEVDTITSNTQITLKTAYVGDTTSETDYSIVRNFTASLPANVAAQTSELLNDFRRYVDADMQSIHGKSAYQIACDHGYVGTESQWVESLKGDSAYAVAVANGFNGTVEAWLESLLAAGEWVQAQASIATLSANFADRMAALDANGTAHNAIVRRKNLGTAPTAEQMAAIRNGTFTDMYIGDYWKTEDEQNTFTIVEFNYYRGINAGENPLRTKNHVVVMNNGFLRPVGESSIKMTWGSIPAGGYTVTTHNEVIQTTGLEIVQHYMGAENLTAHKRVIINGITDHEITSYKTEDVLVDAVMPQQLWGYTGLSKGRDKYADKPFALALLAPHYCHHIWGIKLLRALSITAGQVSASCYGYETGSNMSGAANEPLITFCLG